MGNILYDSTSNGVFVQVHLAEPQDAEWDAMLQRMVAQKTTMKAILAVGLGDSGPTSAQRERLSVALKQVPEHIPFVLLTDSRITRGILTAINWLIGNRRPSTALPRKDLEGAMDFLRLDADQRTAAQALLGSLAPQALRP